MTPVLLIMATLWQQGHWIGGEPANIVFTRSPGVTATDAEIAWQLKYGQIVLQRGELTFAADAKSAQLQIIPPVPQRQQSFTLKFEWVAKTADGGQTLAQDSQQIHVYPPNVLDAPAKHFADRSIAIVGKQTELRDVLTGAGLTVVRQVEQVSQLVGSEPDLIVVEPNGLPAESMFQQPLLDMARRGATVVILSQDKVKDVLGFQVVDRAPAKLAWQTDQLLLATLNEPQWSSIMTMSDDATTMHCVRIGADAQAEPLVYIPPPKRLPDAVAADAATDALLVIQKTGEGQLVISQLPIGSWKTDPRMRVFLANMLELTVSPVEPTPSQQERIKARQSKNGTKERLK